MSGKRVLAVYAALLLGFAVVLCRLYLLALHPAYAARAAAQSTVTLQLPARRGKRGRLGGKWLKMAENPCKTGAYCVKSE